MFTTVEMDMEHVIEEYYMTDELDSEADEYSCDGRPAVIRLNEDEPLRKGFTFKVGMEFSSLSLLWSYGVELRRASQGNTFKLNIGIPTFGLQPWAERCNVCFDGTKKALTLTCRSFIGLNRYHLKNTYDGIWLVVVGRDANDKYLSIAFGVVENEAKDSWS
ncbi:hypothetical protein KIW84_063295 [Lathyrus oleraceus]|uniref:Uncharacterized protein n=1 Tax=Pisum sativum TaxID=3888 RepID=A0A9D4WB67_PEA|nr:hypothetical protein KIW84_063295 [Pisum sativum]